MEKPRIGFWLSDHLPSDYISTESFDCAPSQPPLLSIYIVIALQLSNRNNAVFSSSSGFLHHLPLLHILFQIFASSPPSSKTWRTLGHCPGRGRRQTTWTHPTTPAIVPSSTSSRRSRSMAASSTEQWKISRGTVRYRHRKWWSDPRATITRSRTLTCHFRSVKILISSVIALP